MIDAVIEELKTHQTQLDQDGVMVGVSRQALEELLAHVAAPAQPAPIAGLEPVAYLEDVGDEEDPVLIPCIHNDRGAFSVYTRAQLEAHAAEQVRAERERIAAWHDEQANKCINERLSIFEAVHRRSAAAIRARGQV